VVLEVVIIVSKVVVLEVATKKNQMFVILVLEVNGMRKKP
jgi:hypothetical protein